MVVFFVKSSLLRSQFTTLNTNVSPAIDVEKSTSYVINNLINMIQFKRSKKSRSKNSLFNPYKNGISSYDVAYLSSKRRLKNKTVNLISDSKKDYLAA